MAELKPTQATNHSKVNLRIPRALQDAEFVFIRQDARAPRLTRPYLGPFKVLKGGPKFFEVLVKGKPDKISIDRLKRAFTEEEIRKTDKREEFLSEPAVCYDRTPFSDSLKESRDSLEIPLEERASYPTQPLQTKKRGRPSKAELAQREQEHERKREEERVATRQREEREIVTRTGQISRPPDRL